MRVALGIVGKNGTIMIEMRGTRDIVETREMAVVNRHRYREDLNPHKVKSPAFDDVLEPPSFQ